MTKLSLSFILATALCLAASTSALPFGGRAKGARNQNAFWGTRRPSRGGGMQQQQKLAVDDGSSRLDLDEQELVPIVDLISTSHQHRAPMTVPKIGAAAAALYGVADVGSRIIVNTSGATAPVIMAAGAAGALVTGVWAGGKMQQKDEKQCSLESPVLEA